MTKLPVALAAVRLLPAAVEGAELIYVASSEHRAEGIAALLSALAPDASVVHLPAWDCLPYDRAAPSPDILGRQMTALGRLDARSAKTAAVVVTTPEAIVARLPPVEVTGQALRFAVGDDVSDPEVLRLAIQALGYRHDDRVDDHGEFALRSEVLDIYPSGPTPYRLTMDHGSVVAMRAYDLASQRSGEIAESVVIGPVSTVLAPPGAPPLARFPGMEHRAPEHYAAMRTIFDVLPKAKLMAEPGAEARFDAALALAGEHFREARAGRGDRKPLSPEALYIPAAEWKKLRARRRLPLPGEEPRESVPRFHAAANARRRFAAFVADKRGLGHRVVLAGDADRDLAALAKAAGADAAPCLSWSEIAAAPAGALLALPLPAEHGFVDDERGITMVCAADVLGAGARRADHHHHHPAPVPWHAGGGELAVGDTVIHVDHGVGALRALEVLESEAAGARDMVRLDYAKGTDLLAPIDTMDRLWRYGGIGDAIRLDRLDSDAWQKRRAAIARDMAETARELVRMARTRETAGAPVLEASGPRARAFAARFPFPLTPDQADAIAAVEADLAAGRPMDRLVIGDVGFGKTEVALRAAAVAVLAGRQVAVVAPTTVLVRQHVQSFARRFADLGIEVAQLSRLTAPEDADRVRAGLASGTVRLVVGTHALAAGGIAFADLGLLIIDEEQRFGAGEKGRLRALGAGVHTLTLTATPIPRTLQSALVGLQDISVIATPPARRRPIRTVVNAFDAEIIGAALSREAARGGQSFVVVPRIEGLDTIAKAIAEVAPDLHLLVVHGRMKPEEVDTAMVDFADGRADVLLATSLIESGLDVPRANTMIVVGADLFGVSQLHQLRGRVGRGRLQGICYLMAERDREPSAAAAARLGSLAAHDRLGSGLALAAHDLDLRGAGDLIGEDQAGHVKLIGLGLYQHLLALAVREARGEPVEDWSPEIHIDRAGHLPPSYIPEPEIRLNLYARLARVRDVDEADGLVDEITDRFGPPPREAVELLAVAKLRALCRALGVARIEAGPKAIALDLRPDVAASEMIERAPSAHRDRLHQRDKRLIYAHASETPVERLNLAAELLGWFDKRHHATC